MTSPSRPGSVFVAEVPTLSASEEYRLTEHTKHAEQTGRPACSNSCPAFRNRNIGALRQDQQHGPGAPQENRETRSRWADSVHPALAVINGLDGAKGRAMMMSPMTSAITTRQSPTNRYQPFLLVVDRLLATALVSLWPVPVFRLLPRASRLLGDTTKKHCTSVTSSSKVTARPSSALQIRRTSQKASSDVTELGFRVGASRRKPACFSNLCQTLIVGAPLA